MPKAARRISAARAAPYPANKSPKPILPPTPQEKKALKEKSQSESNIAPPSTEKSSKSKIPSKSTTKNTPAPKPAINFLEIEISENKTSGGIPIYDTCSTVRQKINALLGKDNTKDFSLDPNNKTKDGKCKPFTKASFIRAMNDYCCEEGEATSTRSLETFLKAKKRMGGAESAVYPPAYAFSEKQRLGMGKKKCATRVKVEENRPRGLPLRDPNKMRIWLGPAEHFSDFVDEYGQ